MKKLLLIGASALSITACGGGGSSTTTTNSSSTDSGSNNTTTQSGFCAASGTVTLNGLSIKISDYDTDKNGCLNGDEVAQATKAEQAKEDAKKAKRTVSAKPVVGDANSYKVESLSVIGNRDAVDDGDTKKAVINANETFTFKFKTANKSDGEYLAFYISTKPASQIKLDDGLAGIALFEQNLSEKTITCQYGDGSSTDEGALKANHYKCSFSNDTKDNSKNITDGTSNLYLSIIAVNKGHTFTGNHASVKIEISQP